MEYPVETQSFVCIDITIVITWIEEHINEPADLECTEIITSHECVFNSGGISGGNNGTGSENGGGSSNGSTTNPENQDSTILTATVIDGEGDPNIVSPAINIQHLIKLTKKIHPLKMRLIY